MDLNRIKADSVVRGYARNVVLSSVPVLFSVGCTFGVFEAFVRAGVRVSTPPLVSSLGSSSAVGLLLLCCGLMFGVALCAMACALLIRSSYVDFVRDVRRLRRRVRALQGV